MSNAASSQRKGSDNSMEVPPAQGNMSFVLQKIETTSFEDRPVKAPAPGEVQVNVRQTGLCGSDQHYRAHGRIGNFVVEKPMVLGHESAGIVTAVGEGVTTHKVGDRVALEPGVPCFTCSTCKAGTYHLCPELIFAATPPYDGTLATYYNLHSSFAHHLPDHLSLEEGSLMEPLSVGVHSAVSQGRVRALQSVIVFGAGPVGLLTAAVCKAFGAKHVVVIDIAPKKLEFASSFCATQTFIPSKPNEGEEPMQASVRNAAELLKQMGQEFVEQEGVDLVIECTGAPPCIQMGLYTVKPKGRFVQVGMGSSDVLMPLWRINQKEIEMTGSFRYGPGDYQTSIDLVATGKIDVGKIVTHRYTFEDTLKAFDATAKGVGEDGKATIKVQVCQGPAQ